MVVESVDGMGWIEGGVGGASERSWETGCHSGKLHVVMKVLCCKMCCRNY